jgi:hypothetical protein
MANVYYKISGETCYYTNENKSGYSLFVASSETYPPSPSTRCNVVIELYNNKFVFPTNARGLFILAKNTSFNDMDK